MNKMKTIVASLMLLALPVIYGCPAMLVVYLVSNTDGDDVTVTAEIPRSAKDIFASALKIAQEGDGKSFTVKELNEKHYFMRAESLDDTWWFEMTLVEIDDNTTQLIMIGVSSGDEEEQRDRGLVAVERICNDLKVKYRVVENEVPAN